MQNEFFIEREFYEFLGNNIVFIYLLIMMAIRRLKTEHVATIRKRNFTFSLKMKLFLIFIFILTYLCLIIYAFV